MLTGLLHAHSGLRYLVLVAGAAALVYALVGLFARRPYDRGMRVTAAAFAGLLHLQVLLGIALVIAGIFYGQLIGHIVLMLAAAAAAQAPLSVMRRRPVEQRAYGPHALGAALALLLIWAGLLAIGRGLFEAAFF